MQQLSQIREQIILQLPIPMTSDERAKVDKVKLDVEVDRVLFDRFMEEANVRGFTPSRLLESLLWLFLETPPLSFQEQGVPRDEMSTTKDICTTDDDS